MGKQPKMLYHYCSLDTFLKIITSGKIWLSDVRKSNDKQELRHLKSECAIQLLTAQNEYLERYSEEEGFTYDFKAMEKINALAKKITTTDLFITWVFCLSEEYDLLSQWRGYADNGAGICIGFDYNYLNQINKLAQNDKKRMFCLRPIEYGRESASEFFASQLDINNIPMDFDAFKNTCHTALFSTFSEAPFYKNDSFAEEKEWRIALTHIHECMKELSGKENLTGEILKYFKFGDSGYVVKDKQIVSHVELIFSEIKTAIKEVIIGPKCNMTPVEMSHFLISEGWLKDMEDESIEVFSSSSSYR